MHIVKTLKQIKKKKEWLPLLQQKTHQQFNHVITATKNWDQYFISWVKS